MSNDDPEALAFIQAARRRDFTAMEAIWHRSPNPAILTGQCIGIVLDIAQGIADKAGAVDGGAALVAGILEDAASPTPQPPPEPPARGPSSSTSTLPRRSPPPRPRSWPCSTSTSTG